MKPIKGFKDYTGQEAIKRAKIKEIIKNIFQDYGFQPAETPIIENRKFVQEDNPNDEAVSDIYKLTDKGKRKLALRYEFTFQLKRLMKDKKLPYKRYQIGPVFRDEPTSSKRFRQFIQCDADIIKSTIRDEAEILSLFTELLNKLNILSTIYFNNRKLLNEIFEEQGIKKNKEKIIREIDKLDKLPEKEIKKNLQKYGADKILNIFKKPKSYFKKYESFKEIQELEKYCKYYNLKLNFQPSLVRGLSYYNGTIFEVKTKKIKETILAGGAFNFNNIQSFGASVGLERLSTLANIKTKNNQTLIVSINQDKESIALSNYLRKQNIPTQIYYGKPGKALEYANSYNIKKVIFIGEQETKTRKYKFKDMDSGKESLLTKKQVISHLS